jgi:hypothetical protein
MVTAQGMMLYCPQSRTCWNVTAKTRAPVVLTGVPVTVLVTILVTALVTVAKLVNVVVLMTGETLTAKNRLAEISTPAMTIAAAMTR